MIAEGKVIARQVAESLKKQIEQNRLSLSLAVIITEDNSVVERFVTAKVRFANDIGVAVHVERMGPLDEQDALLSKIFHLSHEHDGIVVQLPLGNKFIAEDVFQVMPVTHDVDVIGATAYAQFRDNKLPVLPPVVGALREVLEYYGHPVTNAHVAVVGAGKLVGQPSMVWLSRMGAHAVLASSPTENISAATLPADIIILGAGSPGLLKPDMIKEGVIILDAGTSEVGGQLVGDADPACAEKARLLTPTPGGIGPVTVAMIFKNLLQLYELRQGREEQGIHPH